jgi:TolB protein
VERSRHRISGGSAYRVRVRRVIAPRVWGLLTATLSMLLVVSGLGIPARAKVPGLNGQIVFSRALQPPWIEEDFGVFVVNSDGSGLRQVTPYHVECPHWSPDGSLIITCRGPKDAITLIINPDTGHTQFIFSPDPTLFITCPIMSPDTTRLLCDQFGQTADPSRMGIYSIRSSDGRGLRRITSNPGGQDHPGDYSPDGRQIVFTRVDPTRPAGSSASLFVVNVDGSGLRQITPWGLGGSEADESWSPDGNWILFNGPDNFGPPDNPRDTRAIALYKVHPDGTGLTSIPVRLGGVKVQAFGPSWSPDGTEIAFGLSAGGVEGIFTANADGSDVREVTDAPIYDAHPDWGAHP